MIDNVPSEVAVVAGLPVSRRSENGLSRCNRSAATFSTNTADELYSEEILMVPTIDLEIMNRPFYDRIMNRPFYDMMCLALLDQDWV